jgi:hypothetical protein
MNPSTHDQPVVVIGVDPHKQTHAAAAVEAAIGGVVEQATASADPAGDERLLETARPRHRERRCRAIVCGRSRAPAATGRA